MSALHETAEALLGDLASRYVVERRDSKEQLGADAGGPLIRVVRLIPRTPAAAPLAAWFAGSPGLEVCLGRWHRLVLTGAEERSELHEQVSALVEGGLWERVRRGLTGSYAETRLVGPGFQVGQEVPLEAADARAARRDGFAAPVRWAPWPSRPQGV